MPSTPRAKLHVGSWLTVVCDAPRGFFEAASALLEIALELMLLEVLLENSTLITTIAPFLGQSWVMPRGNDLMQLEHLLKLHSLKCFESSGKDLVQRQHLFFGFGFAAGRRFSTS